ncbi:MAG: hypothetical protein IPH23_08880 [Gammaproteobacteria bacterium]|nr:hypothetical protein [Gammaproteobacteria bacterium]
MGELGTAVAFPTRKSAVEDDRDSADDAEQAADSEEEDDVDAAGDAEAENAAANPADSHGRVIESPYVGSFSVSGSWAGRVAGLACADTFSIN